MPYGTLVITHLHPAPAVAFACRGAFGQSKDAMDSVDLLRCVWLMLVTGAAYGAVILRRAVLGQKHPLDWPVDLEMMAAGFKVSLRWGNLATLRLMLSFMAHPALFFGLKVEKAQPPGCEPCYWLTLKSQHSGNRCSSSSDDSSSTPKQPDIVLCYVHGGAFVAGHPLMCSTTFERWMKALARQGLTTKVLCISYPLAPERPFPAAVASTAAVFAWAGQLFPAGCGTTVIAVGDSAGGNIVPTSLAALRDYCQHRHPPMSAQVLQQQRASPAAGTLSAAVQPTVGQGSNGSSSTNGHAGPVAAPAPAGEAEHAAVAAIAAAAAGSRDSVSHMSHMPSELIRSDSQAASLTAALEAHLFADLHNRLTVMTAVVNSSLASTTSNGAGAVTVCRTVRMPSAVILVSPAADISPTASFRTRKVPPGASNPTDTATGPPAGPTDAASLAAPAAASSSAGGNSGSGKIHWDYLPENIESGGMGSYAEHHEQLCGVYASPVHLPRVDGLCEGRWLLLAGGVELLYPDIERLAQKLQQALGPDGVLFHVEPRLPHSWAILPTPSMASRQEVVTRFIAAEHAAAVAAAETPAAQHAAAHVAA